VSDDHKDDPRRCSQCGADLADGMSAQSLCPQCLLKLGLSGAVPAFADPPEPEPAAPASRRSGSRAGIWIAALGVVAVAVIALFLTQLIRPVPAPPRTVRFSLAFPDSAHGFGTDGGHQFAVSPDGGQIALTATGADGVRRLWIRALDQPSARELAGTDDAAFPFWSPDSRTIGFFARGTLKRIGASNESSPITLCDAPGGRGGTWSSDGVIIFAANSVGGLSRVPAAGGAPSLVTKLDESRRERSHRWPVFLPDGRRFLYSAVGEQRDGRVLVGDLDTGESRLLLDDSHAASFADGHLLFARGTRLFAQRFDLRRLEFTGEARPVPFADEVAFGRQPYAPSFSASSAGVLAYRNRRTNLTELTWLDRSGERVGLLSEPGDFGPFAVSPNGEDVAVLRYAGAAGTSDLWLLARGASRRLTFEPLTAGSLLWSPDGTRLMIGVETASSTSLRLVAADGSGTLERSLEIPGGSRLESWSMDGRFLLYSTATGKGSGIWALPLQGDQPQTSTSQSKPAEGRKPIPWIQSAFGVKGARFSPDGRWVAYTSDESGRDEVFVQAFPAAEGKWQISTAGGSRPSWRPDGRELFFISSADRLMAVDVLSTVAVVKAGDPMDLLRLSPGAGYAVSPDGRRLLVQHPVQEGTLDAIEVVLNWAPE
jgi:eukaryotic-like serine/threonine-protein kinase